MVNVGEYTVRPMDPSWECLGASPWAPQAAGGGFGRPKLSRKRFGCWTFDGANFWSKKHLQNLKGAVDNFFGS